MGADVGMWAGLGRERDEACVDVVLGKRICRDAQNDARVIIRQYVSIAVLLSERFGGPVNTSTST